MGIRLRAGVVLLATTLATGTAARAGVSYTLGSDCQTQVGAALSCAGGLSISAWSNTVGSDNRLIEAATIGNYGSSGLGITNADAGLASGADTGEGTTPEHAIDNNGRYDALVLDFGAGNLFNLTAFKNGWSSTDSDMTLLAYTGGGDALAALAGRTLSFGNPGTDTASLLNNGWTRVRDYANAGTTLRALTTDISSRYWLVAAYVPLASSPAAGFTVGDDYVKLAAVEGSYTRQVPVPATTLLFGAGALLLGGRLRRQWS